VNAGLDGLEAGEWEVLADEWSRVAKTALAADPRAYCNDPYNLLQQ
jgi:hypothetical protein